MRKLPFAGMLEERLDLPGQALGELRLSVLGHHRALIENHRGLLCCTEESVAVRGPAETLTIIGRELRIEAMDGEDLLLRGRLERAEWGEGEER